MSKNRIFNTLSPCCLSSFQGEEDKEINEGASFLQALYINGPVDTRDTRGARIRRWYYIDIAQALNSNGDREVTIKSIPEDRKIVSFRGEVIADYSTPEKEYEAGLFPLSRVFNYAEWRRGYSKYWNYDSEKSRLFDAFEEEIIKRFEQYLVPLILLRKETPKEAVCQVFEKVNTGGVPLTVFELLTAFSHDYYSTVFPINIIHLDIYQLIQPYAAINKQAYDSLIPDITSLLNQICNLIFIQTWQ